MDKHGKKYDHELNKLYDLNLCAKGLKSDHSMIIEFIE